MDANRVQRARPGRMGSSEPEWQKPMGGNHNRVMMRMRTTRMTTCIRIWMTALRILFLWALLSRIWSTLPYPSHPGLRLVGGLVLALTSSRIQAKSSRRCPMVAVVVGASDIYELGLTMSRVPRLTAAALAGDLYEVGVCYAA